MENQNGKAREKTSLKFTQKFMYPGRNGLSQANEYWSGKNPSPAITAIGSAGGFFFVQKNAAENRQQEGGEETYKYPDEKNVGFLGEDKRKATAKAEGTEAPAVRTLWNAVDASETKATVQTARRWTLSLRFR